jgi:monoterpene epsilon-lactone hydrolase
MINKELDAIRVMLAHSPKNQTTAELRKAYEGLGAIYPPASDVTLQAEQIKEMKAEWSSTPSSDPECVTLYLHGGGYVIGSLASHRHLVAELGRASGTRTLAIDYRLAPEAPFPAAVDDALTAYKFLLANGIDPASIAIAGDSAGGGLTIATLVAARDAGLPQPACGVCISPWVDLQMLGTSMTSKANEDPLLQRELLEYWSSSYLNGAAPRTPLAAPMYADLKGIAPLLIQVGSAEILLDDAVRLAERASAQNVSVRFESWPEMIHVWHFFHPVLAEGKRGIEVAGEFIRRNVMRDG